VASAIEVHKTNPEIYMEYAAYPLGFDKKLAISLVLVTAAIKQWMFAALRNNSQTMGGLPNPSLIQSNPSGPFVKTFTNAK